MSLRISQSLEMRQAMEMALTQSLCIRQTQRIELRLYIKWEDELTRLYRKALERRMVKLYDKHGMRFEYALVRAKDVPAEYKRYGNWAFSHCLFRKFEALLFGKRYAMARGSWLLFVIYDMYPGMPERYPEYAAVHERGEQVTLGDHNLASKLEFAIAREEGKLVEYMGWLEEHCPAKFSDVFSYQTHIDLPDSEEFQEILELSTASEEAVKVRQMIESFEWPCRLLQKLIFYQKRGEEVVGIVTQVMRVAEALVSEGSIPLRELAVRIRAEVAKTLRVITESNLKRYISYPRLDELWRELRRGVDQKLSEMLSRRQMIMASAGRQADYASEVIDAGLEGGLSNKGVLSIQFSEALRAAEACTPPTN